MKLQGFQKEAEMIINAWFKSNYANYVFNLICAKFGTLRKRKQTALKTLASILMSILPGS